MKRNKKLINIMTIICGLGAILLFSILTTKLMAEEKSEKEIVVVEFETKTEEELLKIANGFSKDMGFGEFEEPNVIENSKKEYIISSSKLQQAIIVWYDEEQNEWNVDYKKQPHTRTF